jgi:hypothetical protein
MVSVGASSVETFACELQCCPQRQRRSVRKTTSELHKEEYLCSADDVHVTNNGNQTVNHLRVNIDGFEMFIVFDLGPSEETVLSTLPQTDRNGDRSAMTNWGERSGKTLQGGAAFDIRGKYKGPAHYFINLADDGVSITSRKSLPAS